MKSYSYKCNSCGEILKFDDTVDSLWGQQRTFKYIESKMFTLCLTDEHNNRLITYDFCKSCAKKLYDSIISAFPGIKANEDI